jgi:hypothetical protein
MEQMVARMTVEELRALIEEIVERKLRELLSDPDQGLELREEIVEQLRESLQMPPSEGIAASELAVELSLEW